MYKTQRKNFFLVHNEMDKLSKASKCILKKIHNSLYKRSIESYRRKICTETLIYTDQTLL